jgi:hypothetical protein
MPNLTASGRVAPVVRVALAALLLAMAWVLASPHPAVGATPRPDPAAAVATPDLTGHWAVAGTSGFDIVQSGSHIRGSSAAGIRFAGTLTGADAAFQFWSGTSWAKADPEDRGTGSFHVSPDGRTLLVGWRDEKPTTASLDPVFTAVRVVAIVDDPAERPEPSATWFTAENFQQAQWLAQAVEVPLETVIAYLILASKPPWNQLRADVQAYDAMLYLFRDWDRAHGIKPRPIP